MSCGTVSYSCYCSAVLKFLGLVAWTAREARHGIIALSSINHVLLIYFTGATYGVKFHVYTLRDAVVKPVTTVLCSYSGAQGGWGRIQSNGLSGE